MYKNPVQDPGSPLLPLFPPVLVFTWCLWFVFHHFPLTSFPGMAKTAQILPTAETCGVFHHFAMVESQDTL